MATSNTPATNLLALTDCLYFTNGSCSFKTKCRYRHCQTAMKQLTKCSKWPVSCRDVNCPYRHTGMPAKTSMPSPQEKGSVIFFWNIEKAHIPTEQRPFDIVQRIRQKLVVEPGLQEIDFSCYCKSDTISLENQQSLHHATVRIVHIPDRKPGAVDRQIMLDLDRFERIHRPPATIVLISGDIDFIGKLSDLRHQARFHVVVIHSRPATEELKATVNEHHPWESFTGSSPQPISPLSDIRPVLRDRRNQDRTAAAAAPETEKPPMPHPRSGSVNRRRRPADHTLPPKPLMDHPSEQIPTSKATNNTPSPVPTPMFVPRLRIHAANSTTQPNVRGIRRTSSHDHIPVAVNDDTGKTPHPALQCPHCTNEFSTMKALRQHQTDKNHLFNCPVCKEGFATATGLKQHQNSKSHTVTDPAATDSDTQQSATGFEFNSNNPVENKRFPVYPSPVTNHSTTFGGINNNVEVSSDEE